jgi:hypothetical protein
MAKEVRFVRIKPYNPRLGHSLRKYTHLPTNKKFEETQGWYKVDAGLAKYLTTVQMVEGDPRSPMAFDVCTEAEAKAIDLREKKAKDRKDPNEANDLTTSDLRSRDITSNSTSSPADERRARRAHSMQRSESRSRSNS